MINDLITNDELIISFLTVASSSPNTSQACFSSLIRSHPIVVPSCLTLHCTAHNTALAKRLSTTARTARQTILARLFARHCRDATRLTAHGAQFTQVYCIASDEQREKGAIASSYNALDTSATYARKITATDESKMAEEV